jgi:hypothetical protein
VRKKRTTKLNTVYSGFYRITMAKAAFNKKRVLFTSKMDLELRERNQ